MRQRLKTNRTRDKQTSKFLKKTLRDTSTYDIPYQVLKENMELLGYDLSKELIYKIVFYDIKLNTPIISWRHTDKHHYYLNKRKSILEYNNFNDLKFYNLEKHLPRHCFPLELKNKKEYNNLLLGDQEDRIGAMYINKDTCGSKLKLKSNILILDIDCHVGNINYLDKAYNELQILIKHFGDYLYLERSYEGGFHLYIKLDKEYTLSEKVDYLKQISKIYNLNLTEIPTAMTFPFGYTYEPCNHEFEVFTVIQSLTSIKETINIQKGFELPYGLNTTIELPKIEEVLNKIEYIPYISSNIYSRHIPQKSRIQTPEQFIQTTDISITSGNRHNNMLAICRIGKRNNWTIIEIINTIRNLDKGSNDLKKWDNKTLSIMIENILKSCTIKPIQENKILFQPKEFYSNLKYIPEMLLPTINSDKFINSIIKNCNYKQSDLNRKKFKILISEMIGAIFYDSINERKSNKEEKYLIGKQFSKVFALKLKQHYSKEIYNFDTYTIMHSILNKSNIFSQYKINKRGWKYDPNNISLNFCKQFDLSNNKNHLLFNNKNNIIILFIHNFIKFLFNIKLLKYIVKFFIFYKSILNNFLLIEDKFLLDVG